MDNRLRVVPDGVVIQIQGVASGGRPPPVPTYVKDCDFEAHDGIGEVIFTQRREDAKHFDTAAEALEYWGRQSKTRPLRDDGLPNKPLTAYHACILKDGTDPI